MTKQEQDQSKCSDCLCVQYLTKLSCFLTYWPFLLLCSWKSLTFVNNQFLQHGYLVMMVHHFKCCIWWENCNACCSSGFCYWLITCFQKLFLQNVCNTHTTGLDTVVSDCINWNPSSCSIHTRGVKVCTQSLKVFVILSNHVKKMLAIFKTRCKHCLLQR